MKYDVHLLKLSKAVCVEPQLSGKSSESSAPFGLKPGSISCNASLTLSLSQEGGIPDTRKHVGGLCLYTEDSVERGHRMKRATSNSTSKSCDESMAVNIEDEERESTEGRVGLRNQ